MAIDGYPAALALGGAIGYAPTGRRGRGTSSATGRGSGAGTNGATRSGADGGRSGRGSRKGGGRGPQASPIRQAAIHETESLGAVTEDRPRRGRDGDGDGTPERAGRTSRAQRTDPSLTGERHGPDTTILAVVLSLTALGILMVLTSSAMQRVSEGRSAYETAGPQLLYAAVGVVLMLGVVLVPYRILRLVALPALVISGLLLALLYVSPWGVRVGGSVQWLELPIPGLPRLQPGEFAKLALIIYLASWMQRRGTALGGLTTGFLPFGLIVAPFILMIFMTPDIGSAGVLAVTAVVMYYLAGGSLRGLGGVAALGGVAILGMAVFLRDYQLARLVDFLDPFVNADGTGYQVSQGLLALGLGGLTGSGLGDRVAAGGLALPNAHNDSIFAVVGQETGFVGAALVIIGFMVIAWKGIQVARTAPTTFGALLAGGITAWISVQAFINIGVVVAMLPVTGITLPFVSAGGSSLIVSLVAVGVLLSVSREAATEGGWVDASGDRGRRHGRAHLPGPRRRPVPLGAPGRA